MKRTLRIILLTSFNAMLFAGTPANAGEIFFDEARVLDSQPVYETRQTPVQAQECGYQEDAAPGRPAPALLGDARSADPEADIVVALQTDMDLRAPPEPVYRCRMVTRMEDHDELVGYRVRYEYDGQIYERRVREAPAETIRVRVRLSVGRPEMVTRLD